MAIGRSRASCRVLSELDVPSPRLSLRQPQSPRLTLRDFWAEGKALC